MAPSSHVPSAVGFSDEGTHASRGAGGRTRYTRIIQCSLVYTSSKYLSLHDRRSGCKFSHRHPAVPTARGASPQAFDCSMEGTSTRAAWTADAAVLVRMAAGAHL